MTDSPRIDEGHQRCWCCDNEFPSDALVHLGAHPEVAICFDCARWVGRRAAQRADVGERGFGARVRRALARLRAAVISRGWHDWPVVGLILRAIDRRLP